MSARDSNTRPGAGGAVRILIGVAGFLMVVGMQTGGHGEQMRVVVDAGPVTRICEPVSVVIRDHAVPVRAVLKEVGTGRAIPAQVSIGANAGELEVSWIVRELMAGHQREYELLIEPGPATEGGKERVEIDRQAEDRGEIDITVASKPFTTYHLGPDLPRPFYFPVLGPNGKRVTRAFPMEEGIAGESTDHRHHRSFWFAFGSVNGVDCWTEGPKSGRTLHRFFEALEDGPVYGRLRSVNDWVTHDGKKLMEDVRELRIYAVGPAMRMLDFEITMRATEGPVRLGDTKEGMFAFRVASSMDVPRGGKIENSRGGVNEPQTWGKRAEWCDYSGPVANDTCGIAIMDHPDNFRHPTYWMVRNYGLFACNPFGVRAYTGDRTLDGTHEIPEGDELTFRYRVIIHRGDADAAQVPLLYASYATPPVVRADDGGHGARTLDDAVPEGYGLVFFDDFEDGARAWLPKEGNRWEVTESNGTRVYQLMEPGKQGPVRAPGAFSVIRGLRVSDFVLLARARCLTPSSVKGRDVNVVFGFQDETHFYYAHFSNFTNAIHNAICLVNGQPRQPITTRQPSAARLTDEEFHLIKVVRFASNGRIEAYIDDMTRPIMTAEDKILPKGLVGIGSFDDTVMFDDVRLYMPQ